MSSRFSKAAAHRFDKRFAHLPTLEEHEVGRPHLRVTNPIEAGKLEFLVDPIYDWFSVAVNTAVRKEILFSIPIGQAYTGAGGSALQKTVFHTSLVQAGQLDAPKKFLVKAVSLNLRNDIHASDLANFLGQTYIQLWISGKEYWTSLATKVPAGCGGFFGGFASLTAAASLQMNSNGYPEVHNVATITDDYPQIPGLPAMQPILGVLIEQQQNFSVWVDPTQTGGTIYTTQNTSGTPSGTTGNGINGHLYLEGVLARAVL